MLGTRRPLCLFFSSWEKDNLEGVGLLEIRVDGDEGLGVGMWLARWLGILNEVVWGFGGVKEGIQDARLDSGILVSFFVFDLLGVGVLDRMPGEEARLPAEQSLNRLTGREDEEEDSDG